MTEEEFASRAESAVVDDWIPTCPGMTEEELAVSDKFTVTDWVSGG
jgi:hypothetical protein